jgi:hypothetical protein
MLLGYLKTVGQAILLKVDICVIPPQVWLTSVAERG